MKQLSLMIFLVPLFSYSQIVKGKIYDDDSKVKGALVVNLSQNDTAYSNLKGEFKIHATANDSIMFHSLFHFSKKVKIKPRHFDRVVVFELEKKVNELNEVLLANKSKKTFKPIEYTSGIGFSIKEDMKRNPHLYMPKSSYSGGGNFIELFKLVGLNKLFKKPDPIKYIKYKQFDSIFSNSKLFNDKLLVKDIKIPEQYKYLFYEYCETRKLNADLVSIPDNLTLLDSMFVLGNRFLKRLREADTLKFER